MTKDISKVSSEFLFKMMKKYREKQSSQENKEEGYQRFVSENISKFVSTAYFRCF